MEGYIFCMLVGRTVTYTAIYRTFESFARPESFSMDHISNPFSSSSRYVCNI